MNKQFEFLEFVFDSVYVDLKYDEISLNFTAGSVSVVSVVMWSYLICLRGCRGTLSGCSGRCDCDACTVVFVACVYAKRVRGCEVDVNGGVRDV